MGRLSRDKRDVFYRRAKELGYRARSAFKLLQLDAEFNLFRDKEGKRLERVVDLCAAPGSWSQVLVDQLSLSSPSSNNENKSQNDEHSIQIGESKIQSRRNNKPKIVAVDLQPMAPIDGVICIQGDITSQDTALQIVRHFQGEEEIQNDNDDADTEKKKNKDSHKAQLVVCDGAPDVTGLHNVDEYIQGQLLWSALWITLRVLEPGGTFCAKLFRGSQVGFLYAQLRRYFLRVSIAKPTSSRNSSMEAFCVCQGFENHDAIPSLDSTMMMMTMNALPSKATYTDKDDDNASPPLVECSVPFVACGDLSFDSYLNGMDADKSYPISSSTAAASTTTHLAPLVPPIDPPYETAMQKQKRKQQQQEDGPT